MRTRPDFEIHDQYIPDNDVARFFLRSAAVVLPYAEANQSGVILTAMTLQCPVIATAVGDIPDVIRHEENGVLCPRDVPALADAIVSLLKQPERRECLAHQAKQDAERLFSWKKLVQEYPEKVYRA